MPGKRRAGKGGRRWVDGPAKKNRGKSSPHGQEEGRGHGD